MTLARTAFRILAWLFVLAVAVQFWLAGWGMLGGHSIEAHRTWGFIVLHLIPIAMFLVAILGKMGKMTIGMVFVLFVLVFLQPLFADEELDPQWLRSFHIFDALLIFMLGYHIAQRSGRPMMPRSSA